MFRLLLRFAPLIITLLRQRSRSRRAATSGTRR